MHLEAINSASDFERTKGGVLIPPTVLPESEVKLQKHMKSRTIAGFTKFISGNSLGGMAVLCSGKIHLWIFGLYFWGLQRKQQVAVLHSKFPVFVFF